jgi:hypothetical protein
MVELKPARGRLGHHAGPVVVAAALVAGLVVWLPVEPSGVIALTTELADPSASAAPDPTPSGDVTPPSAEPTASPDSSPTPDPIPSLDPSPEPSPTPTPTPLPPGVIGPDGGAVAAGAVTLEVPPGAVGGPTRFEIVDIGTTGEDPDLGTSVYAFSLAAHDEMSGADVPSFGAPIAILLDASGWDLSGLDASRLAIAELVNGTWSTIGIGDSSSLTTFTDQAGRFSVYGQVLAAVVRLDQASDAPVAGLHRIEPGAALTLSITLRVETRLEAGSLVETLPEGWTLVDPDGGRFDATASTVTWPLRSLPARATVGRVLRLRAPSISPGSPAVRSATFSVRVEQGAVRTDGPDLAVLVAPRVVIADTTAGRVAGPGADAAYLETNAPLVGQQRYEVFRLRFDVRNADALPVRWTPRLEFRPDSEGAFVAVPAGAYETGVAFYASPEWTRNPRGGTMIGPSSAVVAADAYRSDRNDGPTQRPVDGLRGMGLNPMPTVVIPPLSRTVVEFSVRATADALYLADYEFQVTDAGDAFAGAARALVELGPQPALTLSPGQRVGLPTTGHRTGAPAPVRYELATPATADPPTQTATPDRSTTLRFALVPPPDPRAAPDSALGVSALGSSADPIHGPAYGLASDTCAACHSAHRAAGSLLAASAPPQLGPCGSCHDGTLAPDIRADYAAAPQNDPADRAYYQHDPTQTVGHVADGSDALAATLNRHAECADCHNPHNATATAAAPGSTGWSASGRIAGASGITATNGAAGTAPIYTLVTATALEYQLCLKCHSGYTQLLSNAGQPPSRFALDIGVEFNPANLSYHPVEAAGTNDTEAMAYSLSGTSPFKQWTFSTSSTIRCVNCHADSRALESSTADATPVAAEAALPVHASTNRGILIAEYKDRQLKAPTEPYDAGDFALCFLCHGEAPFRDTTGNERADTNFRYHGVHVSGGNLLDHGSTGTDIDTAGDGGGLATCSECHFRIHATSFAVNGQAAGSRLVNFAPDVLAPTGGTIGWRPKSGAVTGSCTLKCHGQPHAAAY